MTKLNYIGKTTAPQVDAYDKVMGTAKYVGDMYLPGMLHGKVLRSPIPHGKIVRLDTSKALQVPGVKAVITSVDFVNNGLWGWPIKDAYILAYGKVRYVGDPIAAVAAETEAAAIQGIKAIEFELEPLPVVSDPHKAQLPESPLIPDECPTEKNNLCNIHIVRNGEPAAIIKESAHVFTGSYVFLHQEHAYLETEGALAIPEVDGGVTVFANDQSPFINRGIIASVLGLDQDYVRVIQPPVGGSFGGKDDIGYQTSSQAARLALLTGKPVRIILTRKESMAASYKREWMEVSLKIGTDKQGKLKAIQANLLADSGAYSSMTPLSSWRATMHAGGPYRYEAASVDTESVYTNNGYSGAFRGFGNNQATGAIECLIDEMAEKFGMDPIDYRLMNLLQEGDTAFSGNKLLHRPTADRCLEWVRRQSNWDSKRTEYARQETSAAIRRGIGVACYFHGSGLGGEGTDFATANIRINNDHSVTLQCGLTDYGQGSRTVFTLIAAEVLGVSPDRIEMLRPDTQTATDSGPTVASRASIVGGNAVRVTAEKVAHFLNLAAADLFQCEPTQLIRVEESYIGPQEKPLSFKEVADHARQMGFQLSAHGYWQIPEIHWDFDKGTGVPYFTYSYGAQIAEVEVNRRTGAVKVLKIWAAHDGGKIIYPLGAKGQMLGGIAQGLGYALTEGFTYKDGYPQKLDFHAYHIPTSLDLPEIEFKFIDNALPEGPFGAKNLAEPVMISTLPAIANAVYQATGVRVHHFPINPDLLKI